MKSTGVARVREFIVNAADAGTETLASPVPLPPDTRPGFLVFAAIAVFASIAASQADCWQHGCLYANARRRRRSRRRHRERQLHRPNAILLP
jgi:hypothetical protein